MPVAQCSCGSVELQASGAPMTSTVCYCDTCREGSRQLEALPGAVPIIDADGGTAYVLFRGDRVRFSRGADLLKNLNVAENSATLRVYAGCCNAPMLMKNDAWHWVPMYRASVKGDVPPVQFRICGKSGPAYPFGFMVKLLTSKIATLLRLP